ncbi:MAG: hypothetical protein J1E81_06055 [Eubacterium sp.]|nr:hypothetical protein [Eubacterium sp.]
MSYYDYDYEAEPNFPEAEDIINEATEKFGEFLRSAFANEYKNIQVAKENNAIKERTLNERLQSINEKERELQKRETELGKSEKEQYDKLKQKWFAELGLAFDIGDTVYYCKNITKRITCPTCNGTRKVKAMLESADNTLSEIEIDCPTCKGYGNINGEKEFEIVEAIVTQIDAHISKRQSGNIFVESSNYMGELITSVWVDDKKNRDSLHIIGKELYKTREQAKARIEEFRGGK